jgi:3-oxoacyl-[acyl-carrier-protein] synthase II
MRQRRVVITGFGAVTPYGVGAAAYWRAIAGGVSGVGPITLFDPSDIPCRIAAEAKTFCPENYLPAKDLRRVGRSVPMALAAAEESLVCAGIDAAALSLEEKRACGVVLGSGGGAPDFTEEQYRLYFGAELRKASAYNVSSSTVGSLSSEISLHFDLKGPSHVVSTGCTSSSDAMGYAFNMIRFGLSDRLVTGGVDATITPGIMHGFSIMGAVARLYNAEPARASRPFDRRRDGFVLGEGAWIFVFEERENALARGARIYAEVLGYGSTCDAYHRVRLDPNGAEPARAMELAVRDGGLAKDEVGYVALHGTSTVYNDKTETVAVRRCFGPRAYEIPMSSVKSMIGHPQGASGAANVAAAVFALNESLLPPTINYEEPDPDCDLDYIPNMARKTRVDVALCNCIGFGSKNSALALGRGDDR